LLVSEFSDWVFSRFCKTCPHYHKFCRSFIILAFTKEYLLAAQLKRWLTNTSFFLDFDRYFASLFEDALLATAFWQFAGAWNYLHVLWLTNEKICTAFCKVVKICLKELANHSQELCSQPTRALLI